MNTQNLDLDVSHPDQVSRVLREAADSYFESAHELEGAWQDPNCGRPWSMIAKILEQAADKIDRRLK